MQNKSAFAEFPELAQKHSDAIYQSGLNLADPAQTLPFTKKWALENLWYDYNTTTNQKIKGRLIDREVILCQSSLVDGLLRKSVFEWEDIQNLEYLRADLSTGEWEGTDTERDEKIDELNEEVENLENAEQLTDGQKSKYMKIVLDIERLKNAEYEYKEVFEWWEVSSWLLEKLKEQGEPILDNEFGEWWGRCTTGQAILLDYVISKIAFDMEILEGQANEWKV